MKKVDIAIVGGGPAGMAAAIELSKHQVNFTLLDSYPQLGGHYFKQPPRELAAPRGHSVSKQSPRQIEFETLSGVIEKQNVDFLSETSVWAVFPDENGAGFTLYLTGPYKVDSIHARYLLLTPGAYDRPLAFPGWQLPGVVTLGGAQMLLKGHGIRPGQRALVAGSGPLLLTAAAGLVEVGIQVVAVLDLASFWAGVPKAPVAFWGQWGRLKDVWYYGSMLARHRVPIHFGQTIFKANGNHQVISATYGKVDAQWQPRHETVQTVEVDTICVSLGFLPNLALTRHLGCAHRYDEQLDAFYPQHDANMATTVPNVYVAGDVTGVGGKDLSKLQGKMAALSLLHTLENITEEEKRLQTHALSLQIASEERFLSMLHQRMPIRPGLQQLVTPETVVCRCEMVQAHQIEMAIEEGARDLKGVKLRTRCGMGSCQGRYCEPHVRQLVASKTGTTPDQVGVMAVRPPLIPTPVGDLLAK
ncbi:MAG: NAD(P)/FAD-dependent oxidoreductase [Chloroflexota bacterium]